MNYAMNAIGHMRRSRDNLICFYFDPDTLFALNRQHQQIIS